MKQENRDAQIANQLDQAAFSAQATQQISLTHPISLADAYNIQAASLAARHERGEQLTGYKLGFTSKAKMEQMGVHEIIWGRLTNQMEIQNGGTLRRTQFIHPRVEPEIAFLIGKKIDRPIQLEEATQFLDGVSGALEIIDSRYKDFKFSLEDVIADNCSSSAYVLGQWHPPTSPVNNLAIQLEINGKVMQEGSSKAILGHPLAAFVEITRILSSRAMAIEPGMIILAGAATSAVHIHSGDSIKGRFENLGDISFRVV
ncbi:MAG: fumarylacetoacetate hydrolase family protein [Bacteroidota bacterium]